MGLGVVKHNVHGSASILLMSLIRKMVLAENFEFFLPINVTQKIRDTIIITIMIIAMA